MEEAVKVAEATTGLQFCVYLGPVEGDDPHAFAESLFTRAGLTDRPGVLLLVAPKRHYVEIVTSPAARVRVPDEACEAAVARMIEDFKAGHIDRGIVHGLETLTEVAGAGTAPDGGADFPDILD
ncbi:MAG: TPM domain-containing protein [Actinobacteria bacterium]|nr:TPM domain-containing protein [Actinomycetota bacterium]